MRRPKWPVRVLAVAWTASAGFVPCGEGITAARAEAAASDAGATHASDRLPQDSSDRRIILKAQGTWQDPPPDTMRSPAQGPMPPWYPPYDTAIEHYRDGSWSAYWRPRDHDQEQHGSWLDAICPLPRRHQNARPGQRRDSWQEPVPFGQGYPAPFAGPGPYDYGETWGR